jgi:hypothetical protein
VGNDMKKLMMISIMLFLIMLTGCSRSEVLSNDYFDNEKSDDISVLWDVVQEYDRFISNSYHNHLRSTYPMDMRSIQHLNDYILYDQTGKIYKEDMINYELTDNRSYFIEGSDLYYYLFESWISVFENSYCEAIKEGVKCYDEDELDYLLYYVDGNQAYVEYRQTINNFQVHLEKMYYYTNVFEDKVFEYTHYVKDVDQVEYEYIRKTTLIEGEGEVSYACEYCDLREETGDLYYSNVNFTSGSRIHVTHIDDDSYQIKFYNGQTQEFYWGFVQGEESRLISYEVYDGNIKLAELNVNYGRFWINLNALDGWSYIEKAETDQTIPHYHLYDENEELIDDILVRLAVSEGDYVFYEYRGDYGSVPEDILNMSRFGLEAPYTLDYHLQKELYFEHVYQLLLEQAHFDRTFNMSYDYVMKILDIE